MSVRDVGKSVIQIKKNIVSLVMMPNDRWNVVTIDPEFFIIRQKSIF